MTDDGLEPLPASLARTRGNTETMVGEGYTRSGEGPKEWRDVPPVEYDHAVECLKDGKDLVWSADARVVAEALTDALNAARSERDEARTEVERLRAALTKAADSCERDRREPDKILCHVLDMRRALIP